MIFSPDKFYSSSLLPLLFLFFNWLIFQQSATNHHIFPISDETQLQIIVCLMGRSHLCYVLQWFSSLLSGACLANTPPTFPPFFIGGPPHSQSRRNSQYGDGSPSSQGSITFAASPPNMEGPITFEAPELIEETIMKVVLCFAELIPHCIALIFS